MIHPASDKILGLPVVAGEALEQGTVLKFMHNGDGRLRALKATAAANISDMGTFLAYAVSPDSQDIDFVGAPESTTFTLNTGTGIGGGTHNIVSGTEMIALGGSKVALVRLDKNSLHDTPASLSAYAPNTILKYNSTSGRLCLDADDNVDVTAAKVVKNDGSSIVVLLA